MAFSIAIWNKNKIVVGISFGVWMTNIAFLIQGESGSLSLSTFLYARNLIQMRLNSGIARVNDKTILYPVVGFNFVYSSVLHGYLRKNAAYYTTPKATNQISSLP
jgi:hypothetical protein